MSDHLPALVVVLPLAAALVAPLLARVSTRGSRLLVLLTLTSSFAGSVACLAVVLRVGPIRYELGGWPPPWGIELVVDALSGVMAVLVSLVALLAAFHAAPWREQWSRDRRGLFDALWLLLAAGLLGMVVTGDLFNLYVFLEISSISGYALLALGGDRARVAVFRYLLVGTVAATFYLLGVGFLYALTGTLNMADVASRLADVEPGVVLAVAVALIVVGLSIKAPLFPLHGWMPDAYACAPLAVTPFIAGAMSKVSLYALIRILAYVLPAQDVSSLALLVLGIAAGVAMLAGGVMAVAQTDLNRLLAYSSIGQMGYVFAGLALGNAAGLIGALLHLLSHAAAKACLFMVGGVLHHRYRMRDVGDFAGAATRSPLALACFTVAALSLVGLPPLGGFFAKWYLVLGALEAREPFLVAALLASSLLSAAYFYKVLEGAFFSVGPEETEPAIPDAGPRWVELAPALVLALLVVALGVFNQSLADGVLRVALPEAR